MADISAIFGILLALGIAFPGMLTAFWLLFPKPIERARSRLAYAPWKVFWLGLAAAVFFSIPTTILIALPFGPAKFLGFSLIALVLSASTLGAAGIAARMADILEERSPSLSPASAFVRAAIALELAAFFPLVGWFILMPVALIVSLGATIFALLRWSPGETKNAAVEPAVTQSQA